MPSSLHRRTVTAGAAAVAACTLALTPLAANAAIVAAPISYSAGDAALSLTPIGTHETGIFDESAAEIVQAHGDRLFIVNAQAGAVTVLDFADPANPTELFSIASAGIANSVAVRADGLGVVAFEAPDKVSAGHVVFFDADADDAASAHLGEVAIGSLPDMVTITDDGKYAVVANEGEPADDFSSDPEGTVSVIKLHPTKKRASNQGNVRTADFHEFEAGGEKTLPADVRVFGPQPEADNPISRNLEPEYITTVGTTAYVTLQENNAIAVVDLNSAKVDDIWALGFKDYGAAGSGIDASDRDDAIDIRTRPGVVGMYQPDAIDSYTAAGQTYLVTANEGDAREWGDYEEPVRAKDLDDDGYGPVCDGPLAGLLENEDLGRLEVTRENGFNGECYDTLYSFGARSFSIWTTDGTQVFDSGDDFEQYTALAAPAAFNSSNDDNDDFDARSDAKGPEPEGIAIGEVDGRTYAFIGLERVGGVMVYDITEPASAAFVTYVNNRDFSVDAESSEAGDLGPEGLAFIPASASPTGDPLLAVGNEVSGTTTLFAIAATD
ncbi:choice-of-anchor I family protein [Microbacter sp. GSS18]|nr:choice-of-anchor I family protein [Microbacter sp. GSS18]